MNLLIDALSAYALTFLVSSSSIMEPARSWIMEKYPRLKIGNNRHFIECRMCVGFWISLLVCIYSSSMELILPVYGSSYFLATQERK